MDEKEFTRLEEHLETKISMVDEFVSRAHKEGISTIEAIEMQNHVRREFSPKQRANFRRQIANLYRSGKISINQKQKMDSLLDHASHIADEHFLRLSKIVPEGGELMLPGTTENSALCQHQGDSRAKKFFNFLGVNFDNKENVS